MSVTTWNRNSISELINSDLSTSLYKSCQFFCNIQIFVKDLDMSAGLTVSTVLNKNSTNSVIFLLLQKVNEKKSEYGVCATWTDFSLVYAYTGRENGRAVDKKTEHNSDILFYTFSIFL